MRRSPNRLQESDILSPLILWSWFSSCWIITDDVDKIIMMQRNIRLTFESRSLSESLLKKAVIVGWWGWSLPCPLQDAGAITLLEYLEKLILFLFWLLLFIYKDEYKIKKINNNNTESWNWSFFILHALTRQFLTLRVRYSLVKLYNFYKVTNLWGKNFKFNFMT